MTSNDRILCISDLHLGPERPDLLNAFEAFLNDTAVSASTLYILGDFFNLWIGDDDTGQIPARVSSALKSLADAGTTVKLMHGNRDFLLGQAFCRDSGAELIQEPYALEAFGTAYLLMHGDSLCTRDTDYMAFRRMVRDAQWQQAFLAKPLEERRAFADQARAKSKAMSSNKAADIMDVTEAEVVKVLVDNGHHTLVHGHTHRPAIHEIALGESTGKRIVLGDWDTQGWYLDITPSGYALESFDI